MSPEILVSWIGNADIAQAISDNDSGPLESILKFKSFDILYTLSNRPEAELSSYLSMLTDKYHVKVIPAFVQLKDPTHFGDIYQIMDSLLKKIDSESPKNQLTLQITSGTPSMTAISILLGKVKYATNFIQSTHEQGVIVPELPFDIAADFHPSRNSNSSQLSSLFVGEAPDTAAFSDIVTQSQDMEILKQKAAIIAKREVPVLITGETGTGKELFAKAIHNTSSRANKPLLVLNCGAIPKDLIDTTLFGYEKGAFTGANTARDGYFSMANGGTLFLDEFGELPLDSQVRLLRVIQQGTYSPVGSTKEYTSDVRIIAATNKDLINEVAEGRFREDLFYRVAIGLLHLPPLRQRTGDLTFLAKALLEQINEKAANEKDYIHKKLSVTAINFISQQAWMGNVRELQATLLRATLWQSGGTLTEQNIFESVIQSTHFTKNILDRDITQGFEINEIIGELTKSYVVKAMEHCHGNKPKAAALLGLKNYQTLNNWIEKYNIN